MSLRRSCGVSAGDREFGLCNSLILTLPENTTAEQKARLLETKVAENMDTISQLRQERSLLSKDHKDLQRRYSELSEVSHHEYAFAVMCIE
jgi:hypothetical protein